MSFAVPFGSSTYRRGSRILVALVFASGVLLPWSGAHALELPAIEHLVVSEVVTGGASASDELIELNNPTSLAIALAGLEIVYVSASGATVSRRAVWEADAPAVQPGGHVLVANEAGIYAPIADALYAAGMAATGGTIALRVVGAVAAVDAVGWGTATGTWLEGTAAIAPAAGSSIERLPGGPLGSTQDTDDNAADFVERLIPAPQNLGSPPTPAPGTSPPEPTVSPTPEPTTPPTPVASATPAASPISIASARGAFDGMVVTVEGTALTASDFHEGGGFLADASGGIAVLVDAGTFARGSLLRVTGTVDDRFSQRTLRSTGTDVALVGPGTEPAAAAIATGSVNESSEGLLVRVAGIIDGSPTVLTAGLAYDLDDGTGAVRVIVPVDPAFDPSGWTTGARVELIGLVSQRDSSGSGIAGYRVMLRDAGDILEVTRPAPSAQPSTPATHTPGPTAGPTEPAEAISISAARLAPKNARARVRGVVTLVPGVIDPVTAVIQDATGAIVLRFGGSISLAQGDHVEVNGTRSTMSGMETLRVTEQPVSLGPKPEPAPRQLLTGDAGEAHEAMLVTVRGELVASARRASSGTVSFEIDDGTGPLRVSLAASLEADDASLTAGTWIEVQGILGQETTGAQPLRGYRVWARSTAEVRVTAPAAEATDAPADRTEGLTADRPGGSLDGIGGGDLAALRVGATLVAGPWAELGVGGLLWDGARLAAIGDESAGLLDFAPPVALELEGMRSVGTESVTGMPIVALGSEPGAVALSGQAPAPPRTTLSAAERSPIWVSLVGRLAAGGSRLIVGGRNVPVDHRCADDSAPTTGIVGVTAVAVGDPVRLIAPCGGIRAAPAVSRTGFGRVDKRPATLSLPPARVASSAAANDPRRGMVAGLFVLSALMLAIAAMARRGPRSGMADESPATPVVEEEGQRPPHLTLVSVPREHGP